jgi:hypothetical protein
VTVSGGEPAGANGADDFVRAEPATGTQVHGMGWLTRRFYSRATGIQPSSTDQPVVRLRVVAAYGATAFAWPAEP